MNVDPEQSIGSLVGVSQAMEQVRAFARKASRVDVPVLILGETGTGKSLLGRVIHGQSPRVQGPFLSVNCAGIPDSLFESEFFGHQRGAFTGARDARQGLLEQAQGGTIFLDEVGELDPSQQAKLLTAVEEGEVRRIGGTGTVRLDLRILSATSADLPSALSCGRFRRDLYHRLAVLTCSMPALRDRPEDVPLLARRFVRTLEARHGIPASGLAPDVSAYLRSRPWPGNVRELLHLLEAALILSEGLPLTLEAVQAAERGYPVFGTVQGPPAPDPGGVGTPGLPDSPPRDSPGSPRPRRYAFLGTDEEEREEIRRALEEARGNKSEAARRLGMARNTLRRKLSRHGLS